MPFCNGIEPEGVVTLVVFLGQVNWRIEQVDPATF